MNTKYDYNENHTDFNLNMSIILELQENDRRRIARELHDITIQELVHIIQKTELCMKYLDVDHDRVHLELASIIQLLRNSIDETRNIIYDLRPMSFDDIGFTEAIQRMADDISSICDFVIETDLDVFEDCITHKNQYISLYRIVNELVRNAVYHSKGNKIDISIKHDKDDILIHVKDNGKGFHPESYNHRESFGLDIVKNRLELLNGSIHIVSGSNGTDIEVRVKNWENHND